MRGSGARPLHIVMALGNNPYPRDTRVRQEALALVEAGFRVTVISPRAADQPRREVVDGVQLVRFPPPPPARGTLAYGIEFSYVTLAMAVYLLDVWLRQGFDVLHVHNPPDTLVLAGLLPKALGKKLVFDHHDLAPELYGAKYDDPSPLIVRVLRGFERLSSRLADRVITVNESYRRITVERNGVDPEHVVVVRNGPPLAQLEPAEPDEALRAKAGTLIGYLGLIARQDGVDHLLRALHHLEHDLGVDDWHAVIIGRAEEPGPLEQLAEELGVARKITWTGFQPEEVWRRLLSSVDICSVPDPSNGLNDHSTVIKTMEYMALGKPVVAYDLAEHRVSAGDAALYAEVNDPLEMARAFARLAGDAQLRACLGAAGRRRVRDGLAWEFSAERLVELYRSAPTW
jgi:glycosyltransferase involved in cell wall biosynthesis